MIAVDTNILVYAHRAEYEDNHERARAALAELLNSTRAWALPWPCVHEFVGNVSNRRIYSKPMPASEALGAILEWSTESRCILISEAKSHSSTLADLVERGHISGAQIHDACIAAICIDHGVTELWTADRDFSRFPDLHTRNPLVR
ncbi:MAG TPA: TA system VapC family ribonuclease toxin [Rudaea sp.]